MLLQLNKPGAHSGKANSQKSLEQFLKSRSHFSQQQSTLRQTHLIGVQICEVNDALVQKLLTPVSVNIE